MRGQKAAAVLILSCVIPVVACTGNAATNSRNLAKRAAEYAAQKKTNEAVLEYRRAIAADPRNGEARLALAKLLVSVGDSQNASAEYVRAADLLPQDLETQLAAGRLLLVVGRFDDARGRAEKALKLQPKNVDAQILRGNALAGLKDFEPAIASIEAALAVDPSSSAAQANLGALQFAKGDVDAAAVAFKRAVAMDPKSVSARLALANYYWTTNQKFDAEAALKAAIALDPKNMLANRALALLYLGSERRAQAEQPLKVFADVAPPPEGMLVLADYYATAQRYDDARAILEHISNDPAAAVRAKLRLASLGLLSGDRAEANRLVDQILKENPRQYDALVAKARLQMEVGKLDDALASAKAAVASKPDSAQTQFVLGLVLKLRNQRQEAVQAFNDALHLNPTFAPAQVELGKIAILNGKNDEAIQLGQNALHNAPGYGDAYLVVARAQLAAHNTTAAEQTLKALESSAASNPVVRTELGRLYLAQGNRTKARAAFSSALQRDPDELDALQAIVGMDIEDRKPTEARARVDAAMTASPNNGNLNVLAGRIYASVNDLPLAERTLKHGLELDPNNIQAYASLAQVYVMQRRLPEATAEFIALATRQPRSPAPMTVVGVLLQLQNKTSEAKASFQRALEIDPHAAVAANNLAWLYAASNERLDVALQLAQTAKAQLPDRREVDDTLGWIYYKKGLSTLAVASFEECVRSQPRNPGYIARLGLAYAQSGDKAKARESLERALKMNGSFDGADEAKRVLKSIQG